MSLTKVTHQLLDGIEAGADVTDTTNVVAALSAGTGISLSVGGVIANTSPDQTVALTGAGATSISGTYPNFTITSTDTNTDTNTTYTAGSGLSLTGTEFANTAPDQTVTLTGAGTTTVSGTYPNFTITGAGTTYTAGTGITLTGTEFQLTDTNAKLNASAYTAADVLTKIKTVDGSGSGLDADTVDGQHGSYYAPVSQSLYYKPTREAAGSYLNLNSATTAGIYRLHSASNHTGHPTGSGYGFNIVLDNSDVHGHILLDRLDGGTMHIRAKAGTTWTTSEWNKVWTSGNDGAGSGLDADTVDGFNTSAGQSNDTIAVRTSNGYLHASYFNGTGTFSTSGASSGMARFTGTNGSDTYGRSYSAAAAGLLIGQSGGMSDIRTDLVVHGSYRDHGMFGTYDSNKTAQIWSMGTSYRNHSSGTNFGNLYGLAYKHTNNSTGGTMAGGHQMVWCQNGTGYAAMGSNIWTSGNVTAYSDIRVKENLKVIPNALDKVMQLNGYTYDRTDLSPATTEEEDITYAHNPTGRHVGVIAQEVLKVLPEAVTGGPNSMDGTDDDHYSVAYGNMVALLIEAVKELKAEVEELKGNA